MRAAGHFTHEHAHEVGIATPRTEKDLRNAGQSVTCTLVGLLDCAHGIEHVPPRLAKDRLEQLLLGAKVVVQQAVRDACLFCDVTDARGVVALVRKHAHRRVENEPALVLLAC